MMDQKYDVAIVGGCGHVGLPLGLVLADCGHNVQAFDIDIDKVQQVNTGKMPFKELGAESLLVKVLNQGNFVATNAVEVIRKAQIVIVVIGTPVDENLSPNPNTVIDEIVKLKDLLNCNQLLLLRSTVYPGVTRKLDQKLQTLIPGISIAFTPERIIEGQAIKEIRSLPQIIGTTSSEVYEKTRDFFESLLIKTIHVSPEEAELAKLFTNVWRYIKFAIANQFWMMSNDLDVDYEKVRRAIAFEYPRAADLPSAGFTAGPCLFKDTMQLSALVQQNFPLGNAAMMINEGMPNYLVARLSEAYDLENLKVGILGMAFKAEVDDVRSSLAFKLRKLLNFKAMQVLVTDPYAVGTNFSDLETVLRESDLLVIAAPHEEYRLIRTTKPIVDIWGFLNDSAKI
jgi:UDP-N-acetyl-D-mannosaminuronic acid dehydrogenase